MDSSEIIIGSIIALVLIVCLTAVRLGWFSARVAGILMMLSPFLIMILITSIYDGDSVELLCVGSLLALAFGPATYVMGQRLEKIARGESEQDKLE